MTAAAVLNPGMAAWKTLFWEGELEPGQTVLVLGATGTSGRIATQLTRRHGARVVTAGRNQRVLTQLLARGPVGAFDGLLRLVAEGEISLDVEPVPLAEVEQAWPRAGSDRRVVFVP